MHQHLLSWGPIGQDAPREFASKLTQPFRPLNGYSLPAPGPSAAPHPTPPCISFQVDHSLSPPTLPRVFLRRKKRTTVKSRTRNSGSGTTVQPPPSTKHALQERLQIPNALQQELSGIVSALPFCVTELKVPHHFLKQELSQNIQKSQAQTWSKIQRIFDLLCPHNLWMSWNLSSRPSLAHCD